MLARYTWLAAVAGLFAGAGCVLEFDYSNTAFRCDVDERCPAPYVCVGGVCIETSVPDGGSTPDTPRTDAVALICGDGLCTEDCGTCEVDCGVCLAGQLVHWPFDDSGATAIDATGNGNHGTIVGAQSAMSSRGRVLTFDGVDDWVELLGPPTAFQTPTVAISLWVKAAQPLANDELMSFGDTYALRLRPADGAGQYFQYNGVDWTAAIGTTVIGDDTWHHILGQFDGAEQQLWIDGVLDSSTINAMPIVYALGLDLFAGKHGNGGTFHFGGQLDDVRVFDRALTPAEITALATDQ